MTARIAALRRPLGTSSAGSRIWQHGDLLFRVILLVAGIGVIALMLGIGWELWSSSALSRTAFGFSFLFSSSWIPRSPTCSVRSHISSERWSPPPSR